MHRFVVVFFASFFFFSSVFCHCVCLAQTSVDDDSKSGKSSTTYPFDRDTEKIVSELRSSQEAATSELAEEFAIAAKRLENSKLPPDQILKLRDALRKEETRFIEQGLIPFSEQMRSASVQFLRKMAEANSRAEAKFSKMILRMEKKLDAPQLAELKRRQKSALTASVVARWNHQTGGNPLSEVRLLSNGRIGEPDSANHWTLNVNGNIQLRWPSSNAPDGVWIDSSQLSVDGMQFRGKNQHNAVAFGTLITE